MGSSIVPVPKQDGNIRLCGDYKVSVNSEMEVDQYPLPKPADLFASLTGGMKFTKLDLTSAYQQVVLDEESSKLVWINTHPGLYECTRLPFGVASAPALFERIMDTRHSKVHLLSRWHSGNRHLRFWPSEEFGGGSSMLAKLRHPAEEGKVSVSPGVGGVRRPSPGCAGCSHLRREGQSYSWCSSFP